MRWSIIILPDKISLWIIHLVSFARIFAVSTGELLLVYAVRAIKYVLPGLDFIVERNRQLPVNMVLG